MFPNNLIDEKEYDEFFRITSLIDEKEYDALLHLVGVLYMSNRMQLDSNGMAATHAKN